ncbi:MAG: circularly permuted type 2 ATP-grasp protein, partial [Pseudomonadota bacterium]
MTSDAALAHDTTLMPYAAAHAGRYDEAVTPDGTVRPAWRDLLTAIAALSPAERMRRAEQIDASVRQTGIAFDPFADPLANESCWHLNLMPLLLSDADWSALSAATLQRARLSDRLVGDVYGSQTLLESGALPPELIFADAAYLRPAEGTVAASGGVTFFAADFARWPDGAWRIIDTHTETVAGISYAIANRVTLTHVLGDIFKACNAVRIATHFSAVQAALRETAGGDTPRMALLTPGPHHPDYFAHAYLARYLGLFLVEGFDLRTAGDRVALKTLEGLQDIDLIVRCVEGIASDPLHLDGARLEAPPGLIDVVRTKQRLCANAIGSAIAQNRGIGPHLDGICERLLGEPLGVPDAPRLWLGDAAHRTRVLGDLDRYVIRTAQETTGRPGQAERGRMAGALTAEERDRLVLDIEMSGARFVAEEPATFATAPAFSNGVLEPMPFALRLFAVRSGDTFRVMPGGLAMGVAAGEAVALTAPQGHARDVWVTADRPQNDTASLWKPAIATARVDRSNKALQSRVADTLFWIGRLSERADWTLRMTRSALRRTQEDGNVETGRRAARRCLAALLVDTPAAEQPARADNGAPVSDPAIPEIETLVTTLIRDPQAARGLHLTCAGLYRNATQARDRLSLEAWHVLSGFRVAGPWMRGLARGSSSQA